MHGEENTIDTMWLDGFPWPVVGAMTRASRVVRLGPGGSEGRLSANIQVALLRDLRVVSLDRAVLFANTSGIKNPFLHGSCESPLTN